MTGSSYDDLHGELRRESASRAEYAHKIAQHPSRYDASALRTMDVHIAALEAAIAMAKATAA